VIAMIRLTLRSVWYLLVYQVVGWLLFSVALTGVTTAVLLGWTLVATPLLVAAAATVRWCAEIERGRLRPMTGSSVQGSYREPDRPGLIARALTPWKDVAIWRNLAYLVGLFVPLVTIGLIVITLWLCCIGGITLPLWYHFPVSHFAHGLTVHGVQLGYFPNGPHGAGAVGWYIQTLPQALLVAALAVPGLLVTSYLVVITARAHSTIARVLLRAPRDPLAEARQILERPLIHN
jgi:putative sensor protein